MTPSTPGRPVHPATQPQGLDLDAMAAAARHRITSHINRAAGQHLRALRKTYPPHTTTATPQETTV